MFYIDLYVLLLYNYRVNAVLLIIVFQTLLLIGLKHVTDLI
jgi:hypothetical protein